MFLGNIIKEKRKERKMTQSSLAEGICRQYIISKIEKHNLTPSIGLLIPICLKLGLTLNDVFSDFSTEVKSETSIVLEEIENQVLMSEPVQDSATELSLITLKNLSDDQKMSYYFLNGWFVMPDSAFSAQFEMDKLLRLTKMDTYNIYTELAYTIKGLAAEQQHDDKHALEYYKMIQDALQANSLIPNATFKQLLLIFSVLSKFYARSTDWKKAKETSKRGIKLAQDNKSLLHLDDFYAILADSKMQFQEDNQREKKRSRVLSEILDDAI